MENVHDLTDLNTMALTTCENYLVVSGAREERAKFKLLKQL